MRERIAAGQISLGVENIEKEARAVVGAAQKMGRGVEGAFKSAEKAQADTAKATRATTDALRDQEEQLTALQRAFRDADAARSTLSSETGVAGFSGDVASSTAGLRGAADVFSGGDSGAVGGLLEITEALADVGEFAPIAATQARAVGEVFRSGSGIASQYATTLGNAIAAQTGMSAATASFLSVAVPVVAVLGGLALAANNYNKAAKKQSEELERQRAATEALNALLASGSSTEDAQAELDALRQLRDEQFRNLQEQEEQNAEIYEKAANYFGPFRDAALGIDNAMGGATRSVTDATTKYRSELQATEAQIVQVESAIKSMAFVMGDAVAAQEAQINALVAETELRQRAQIEAENAIRNGGNLDGLRNRQSALEDEQSVLEANIAAIEGNNVRLRAQQGELERMEATGQDVTEEMALVNARLEVNTRLQSEHQQSLAKTGTELSIVNDTLRQFDFAETLIPSVQRGADAINNVLGGAVAGLSAMIDKSVAGVQTRISFEEKLIKLIEDGDPDAINSEIEALRRRRQAIATELPLLQQQALFNENAAQELEKYNDELDSIASQTRQLTEALQQAAQDALADLASGYQQEIAQIEADRQQAISEAVAGNSQEQQKLIQEVQKRQQALNKKRRDALDEYQEQEQKIVTQHRKRILDIEAKGREGVISAAARLDAAAVAQAQRQRELELEQAQEQLEEQQDTNKDKLDDTKDALSDEKREINRYYQDRSRELQNDLNAEINKINSSYTTRLNQATNQYNTERTKLEAHYRNLQTELKEHTDAEFNVERQGQTKSLNSVKSWASAVNAVIGTLKVPSAGAPPPIGGGPSSVNTLSAPLSTPSSVTTGTIQYNIVNNIDATGSTLSATEIDMIAYDASLRAITDVNTAVSVGV